MKRIFAWAVCLVLLACGYGGQTRAQAGVTCPNTQVSRLTGGVVARVVLGDANNVRSQPSRQAELLGQIPGGGVFNTLEGPTCADGFAWYKVDYQGSLIGWTVEGTASEYWIEPIDPPMTATLPPTPTATATPAPILTATPIIPTQTPSITPIPSITPTPTDIPTLNNPFLRAELAVINRLEVGGQARVAADSLSLLWDTHNRSSSYRTIEPWAVVTIIGSPVEEEGFRWWPIRTADEQTGWLPELKPRYNGGIEVILAPLCPLSHVAKTPRFRPSTCIR